MKHRIHLEPAYLREAFLSEFFLADVLFTRFCTPEEMRAVFDRYAEVFRIRDADWLEEIWRTVSSDLFALADNAADFNRLLRLGKHYPDRLTATEHFILSQKAPAIRIRSEILRPCGEDTGFRTALSHLDRRASGGDVHSLSLLAFLQYNGFLLRKNRVFAAEKIKRAASWNHLFAVLMGLDLPGIAPIYRAKLCALFRNASDESTLGYLSDEYGIPEEAAPDKLALALEYAFARGTCKRDCLSPDLLKVMSSTVLDESTKCRLLRESDDSNRLTAELPLGIDRVTVLAPHTEVFGSDARERAEEFDRIRRNLSMLDLRGCSCYKPLLLVCENDLVLDFYRQALTRCFAGAPLSRIDLSEGEPDLRYHAGDNRLISAMNKLRDRNSVLLLEHPEALSPEMAGELAKYLAPAGRRACKIRQHPTVELDLSGMLPILLATALPKREITAACDVVHAEALSRSEFQSVLKDLLDRQRVTFGVDSLSAEDEVAELLFDYAPATVPGLVNTAIATLREDSPHIRLTVATLKPILDARLAGGPTGFWRRNAV